MMNRPLLITVGALGGLCAIALAWSLAHVDSEFGAPKGVDRTVEWLDGDPGISSLDKAALARSMLPERPIDGRLYRLISVAVADEGDINRYRGLIKTATRLDPRDRLSRIYLLEDELSAGHAEGAAEQLDVIMRLAPSAIPVLVSEMAPIYRQPALIAAIKPRLRQSPNWGPAFIAALAKQPGLESVAYGFWSDTVVPGAAQHGLFDAGFEREGGTSRFDWNYPDIPGVEMRLETKDALAGKQSLALNFQGRAVQLWGPYQDMVLNPGTYSVTVMAKDSTTALRPFSWSVRCINQGRSETLGTVAFGGEQDRARRKTELRFTVPEGCSVQRISLSNGARSTIERQISGNLITELVNFSH